MIDSCDLSSISYELVRGVKEKDSRMWYEGVCTQNIARTLLVRLPLFFFANKHRRTKNLCKRMISDIVFTYFFVWLRHFTACTWYVFGIALHILNYIILFIYACIKTLDSPCNMNYWIMISQIKRISIFIRLFKIDWNILKLFFFSIPELISHFISWLIAIRYIFVGKRALLFMCRLNYMNTYPKKIGIM